MGPPTSSGSSTSVPPQVFSFTADKEIRTDDLCLDVSRLNGPVVMLKCHHMKGNQMFEYDAKVSAAFVATRLLAVLRFDHFFFFRLTIS
ncbi:hypothetical protein CRUP_038018 [Coryphaenoides rupestris]|nr:hypothetical protein CRUP_038018 [Coryphaenoides rupestris]